LKGHIRSILLAVILISSIFCQNAIGRNIVFSGKIYHLDSILNNVFQVAPMYARVINDYHADCYTKEQFSIIKKNFLFRYLPSMFHVKHNERNYIRETVTKLHFKAPNIYDQKIISSIGTIPKRHSMTDALVEYFHVNIYSTTLLYSKLLSPLSAKGRKYYCYNLDSVYIEDGQIQYKISFKPKMLNDQLVTGEMIVTDKSWSIREFIFSGESDLVNFSSHMYFGKVGTNTDILPVKYEVESRIGFMGNRVRANFYAVINYNDIQLKGFSTSKRMKNKYDLSNYYTLATDTNSYRADTAYFNSVRPIPLDSSDRAIYKKYEIVKYQEQHHFFPVSKTKQLWGQLGDILLDRYRINFNNAGSIRFSPLINPFLVSYSKNNGFSYQQTIKYNCLFANDNLLRIAPRIGYNFTRGEFYWRINSEFNYMPRKIGAIHFNIGNGNRIYSSDVLDDLKSMPDSTFNFNKIKMDYFRDFYMELYHSFEIVNGLELEAGIIYHQRTPVHKYNPDPNDPTEIVDKIRSRYRSFAPRVRLEWTPGQFYYMNGRRKVNLKSYYPTFSVDWERGIKDVFGSTGKYERIEVDMQHSISLGLMRTIFYRVGTGAFTNLHQLYFVDFVNFSRNNLPEGWSDEISGVFQLLDRRWYNSSYRYLRGHFTYETPFLVIPRVMKIMRNIVNERLYVNVLMIPHLSPYVELGYGIGTPYFNFGLFTSFNKRKYMETGCKFTFELFDK
jgi:hypothetical protein